MVFVSAVHVSLDGTFKQVKLSSSILKRNLNQYFFTHFRSVFGVPQNTRAKRKRGSSYTATVIRVRKATPYDAFDNTCVCYCEFGQRCHSQPKVNEHVRKFVYDDFPEVRGGVLLVNCESPKAKRLLNFTSYPLACQIPRPFDIHLGDMDSSNGAMVGGNTEALTNAWGPPGSGYSSDNNRTLDLVDRLSGTRSFRQLHMVRDEHPDEWIKNLLVF